MTDQPNQGLRAPSESEGDARASDELATLIAAQEKDAQWGHRVDARGPSLDFAFEDGGSFGEIVGYQGNGGDSAIRNIPRPQKWTRRQIVSHIQRWAKEHGEPPKCREWSSPRGRGIPSSASVARYFGSWDEAIRAAGFEARGRGGCDRNPGQRVPRVRRRRETARLSTENLAAAYVLYDRQKLSTRALGDLLWQRFGFASPELCKQALHLGFHSEGFKLRNKREARLAIPEEKRRSLPSGNNSRRLTAERKAQLLSRLNEPLAVLASEFGISISGVSYYRRKAAR